jgi:hypothetical protein
MAKKEYDIELKEVLAAIDRKDIDWWETLTPSQQNKFSSWLYMRYISNVSGSADFAEYYLAAVNERVNKKFNTLKDHPKLQYLLLTTASPGLGKQFHSFIKPGKRGTTNKKRINLLEKLFPLANNQELEVLDKINTDQDIENYLIELGWTDKEIKNALSNKDTDED